MQQISNSKNLNIDTTIITQPKLNKNKQLSAAILNENTKGAIYIQTPPMIPPFGVTSYDGGKGIDSDAKTWSMSLKAQGPGTEFNDDINKLFEYLKSLDEKAIDYGLLNSQILFKKKYDEGQRTILQDLLYNKGVKPSVGADGTVYPDKITCKIMKKEDMSPDLLVFKDSQVPLEINGWDDLVNNIPKGAPLQAIIQPKIYFVNGKFGINFRLVQVKISNIQRPGRPISYAFSDLNEISTSSETSLTNVTNDKNKVVETDKKEETTYDSEGSEVDVDEA